MILYLLFVSLFFFFAFIEKSLANDNQRRVIVLVSFLLLIMFDGLRWESGTDWDSYHDYFTYCLGHDNEFMEYGYKISNMLIRVLTDNYTIFLILYSLFFYSMLFRFLQRYSDVFFLSLFLYVATFLPYQGMHRQLLAIVICLNSIPFLLSGDKKKFVLIVLGATLFHTTALVFLISMCLTRQFRLRQYLYLLLITIVVANVGLVSALIDLGISLLFGNVGFRLAFYSSSNASELAASGVSLLLAYVARFVWIIPFFMKMYEKKILVKEEILFFNMYFFGILIYVLFNGSPLQIIAGRGAAYFSILQCILISYILEQNLFVIRRTFIQIGIYLFGLFMLFKGIKSYDDGMGNNVFLPYKSVYYNIDVRKDTG